MLGVVSRFLTEISFKIEKVHAFQEKNASNKFNIFIAIKPKRILYDNSFLR